MLIKKIVDYFTEIKRTKSFLVISSLALGGIIAFASFMFASDGSNGAKILETSLSYDRNSKQIFSIRKAVIKNAQLPKENFDAKKYRLQVLGLSGAVLAEQGFNAPSRIQSAPPIYDGDIKEPPKKITNKSFKVTVAWPGKGTDLRIIDDRGKVIVKKSLKRLGYIRNKRNYKQINGERFRKEKFSNNFPSNVVYAAGNRLNIVFIGNGYNNASLGAFRADVDRFVAKILTIEPYKSRAGQISFSYVENTKNLECTYEGRAIYCNDDKAVDILNNSGVNYDDYIIINNNINYGGSAYVGSPGSAVYNGSLGPDCFVHELGHSLASLDDEYITGQTLESPFSPCSKTKPNSAWAGLVAINDYTLGCDFDNYYRPAPTSIMYSLSYKYFDVISQKAINKAISSYAGTYKDTSAPTSAISYPLNGSGVSPNTGVGVSSTVSDNAGVARVELLVDDILYSTKYVSPYSFTWSTTGYANGSHILKIKAYDVANNIGTSAVTLNLGNTQAVAPSTPIFSWSADPGCDIQYGATPGAGSKAITGSITAPVVGASVIDSKKYDFAGFSVNGANPVLGKAYPSWFQYTFPTNINTATTIVAKCRQAASPRAARTLTVTVATGTKATGWANATVNGGPNTTICSRTNSTNSTAKTCTFTVHDGDNIQFNPQPAAGSAYDLLRYVSSDNTGYNITSSTPPLIRISRDTYLEIWFKK